MERTTVRKRLRPAETYPTMHSRTEGRVNLGARHGRRSKQSGPSFVRCVIAYLLVVTRWLHRPCFHVAVFLDRKLAEIRVPIEESIAFRTIGILEVRQSGPNQNA